MFRRAGKETGNQAEQLAGEYLRRQGLRLIEHNYRCRRGEIDLIMRDGDCLVFVEVRYRRRHQFGSGMESVTLRKQQRITLAAQHYLLQHYRASLPPCRFDVVGITGERQETIDWIKDAFQPGM